MAIKGLSIPVFGKYQYNPTSRNVSYVDGLVNPHAIEYTMTPESSDSNPLYGDNRVIENDKPTFNTATLSLGVDELDQKTSKYILGVKIYEQTYGNEKKVEVTVYDDDQKAVTVGVGLIELHQIDDVDHYRAVLLKRVVFNLPENTATTKGESVEWQTKTIEGTVSRSEAVTENEKYPWMSDAWFLSEADALEWLQYSLGVGTLKTLEIESAAGTTEGTTRITVNPKATGENVYYYQLGQGLEVPGYNADCTGMMQWDGEADIQATAGQQVMIVECDGVNARAAGIATVTVNGGV